jgi:chromosome segregation ATPase
MGAYTEGRNNPLFAIPSQSSSTAHLADAISEVESFLTLVRHIETSLAHEKTLSKKLREELKTLETTHSQLKQEHDTKAEEFKNREKKIEGQFKNYIESVLSQEKLISKKLREHIKIIETKYNELRQYCEKLPPTFKSREKRLLDEIDQLKYNEKRLRSENTQVYEVMEQLKEDKKKLKIENELQTATLDQKIKMESSYKQQIYSLKSEFLALQTHIAHQKQTYANDIQNLRMREQSFRAHINGLNQNLAQSTLGLEQSSSHLQKKLSEAQDLLEQEKRKNIHLEELFIKERREKQLALTHLHAAESRISLVSQEVDELKNREFQNSKNGAIKIQF